MKKCQVLKETMWWEILTKKSRKMLVSQKKKKKKSENVSERVTRKQKKLKDKKKEKIKMIYCSISGAKNKLRLFPVEGLDFLPKGILRI